MAAQAALGELGDADEDAIGAWEGEEGWDEEGWGEDEEWVETVGEEGEEGGEVEEGEEGEEGEAEEGEGDDEEGRGDEMAGEAGEDDEADTAEAADNEEADDEVDDAAASSRAAAFFASGPSDGSAFNRAPPTSAAVGAKRSAGPVVAAATCAPAGGGSATSTADVSVPAAVGSREVDLRRALLRRLSPASAGGAVNASNELDDATGGRGAVLKRMRRFERDAAGLAAASSGAGRVGHGYSASVLEALRVQPWYAPPPYTWSVLEFGLSTDQGAAGRNFADGGGWGRCEGLCPEAEAHERLHIAPNVNPHEQPIDETSDQPEAFLVTMFHRNDAARVWQPTDIRSISALAAAVEHMMTVVLDRPLNLPFIHRASFIRDRLRQVRQELTMQADSFSLPARLCAVDLLEICARFHIIVEHKCCELGLRNLQPDEAKFDSKMNMQMYTQALSGLMGIYEVPTMPMMPTSLNRVPTRRTGGRF